MDQPDHDVESLHQADNLMTYLSNVEYFTLSDDFMRHIMPSLRIILRKNFTLTPIMISERLKMELRLGNGSWHQSYQKIC